MYYRYNRVHEVCYRPANGGFSRYHGYRDYAVLVKVILFFVIGNECMWACRRSVADQEDIEPELGIYMCQPKNDLRSNRKHSESDPRNFCIQVIPYGTDGIFLCFLPTSIISSNT